MSNGNYAKKIESCVSCNSVGDVQILSSLTTVIKETIPSGQSWDIVPYDQGDVNRFSYSTSKAGGVSVVKWIACVEVITVSV